MRLLYYWGRTQVPCSKISIIVTKYNKNAMSLKNFEQVNWTVHSDSPDFIS